MFKIVTRNSVYTVSPAGNGFLVSKTADMWGRAVKDSYFHTTPSIEVAVGQPFVTSVLRTTPVLAVVTA